MFRVLPSTPHCCDRVDCYLDVLGHALRVVLPIMSDIRERVVAILAEVLEIEPSEAETASMLTADGWDSLATVTIIAAIEAEFGIVVPAEEYEILFSADGIVEVVGGLLG